MIKSTFPNGDYVIHNIGNAVDNCKVSAWYDKDGQLADCAYYRKDSPHVERNIPPAWVNVRNTLKSIGRVYMGVNN